MDKVADLLHRKRAGSSSVSSLEEQPHSLVQSDQSRLTVWRTSKMERGEVKKNLPLRLGLGCIF